MTNLEMIGKFGERIVGIGAYGFVWLMVMRMILLKDTIISGNKKVRKPKKEKFSVFLLPWDEVVMRNKMGMIFLP